MKKARYLFRLFGRDSIVARFKTLSWKGKAFFVAGVVLIYLPIKTFALTPLIKLVCPSIPTEILIGGNIAATSGTLIFFVFPPIENEDDPGLSL